MSEKILVVEDESTLLETLAYNLIRQGYSVETTANGLDALEMVRNNRPDLVVLDVMLPGMDGFDVCRIIRQELNVPIIMLTARDDEIDRVIGLEMGADDYLTKPFSMREFLARVKALLRRVRLDQTENFHQLDKIEKSLVFGNLVVDPIRREVRLLEQPLSLKPKEYELLLFFAQHRGQMVSREMILERVWGWDFSGGSRTVDVHVSWLREKIEKDPVKPERILTVRGAGYRFEG
jgi:DNA-binding response OmpR family regulator